MTPKAKATERTARSSGSAERTVPANAYRAEYTRRDRIPAISDVLSGRLSYLDTCRAYDVQSNQLYAWAGKAIINAEPEAIAALAGNSELMARLTSLATVAGAPALPTGEELERALGRLLLAGRTTPIPGEGAIRVKGRSAERKRS